MATDISNYEKVSPWKMKTNDNVEYYDKSGKNLGYLVEKKILKERTFNDYDYLYYPGIYELTFSNGDIFKQVFDITECRHPNFCNGNIKTGESPLPTFYKKPAKVINDDNAGGERPFVGGRNRKQSKRGKTSKKRKHRRKSIRRLR
jgi:hypothetical protein